MKIINHIEEIGNGESVEFGYFGTETESAEAKIYMRAVERTNAVACKRMGFEASGKLTADGIRDEMAKVFTKAMADNADDMRIIEKQLGEADANIARLVNSGTEKHDKTDAYSTAISLALAERYRNMDADERTGLHLEIGDGKHQAMAQALLTLPNILTGIREDRKQAIQAALIPAEARQQIEYIQAHQQRLKSAQGACEAAAIAMRKHARLNTAQAREALGQPSPTAALLAKYAAKRGA